MQPSKLDGWKDGGKEEGEKEEDGQGMNWSGLRETKTEDICIHLSMASKKCDFVQRVQ